MTLLDGITSRSVSTPHTRVGVLEREADDAATPGERTIVFLAGDAAPATLWQELLQDLPTDVRAVAIDGVVADDELDEVLDELGIDAAHLVGWLSGTKLVARYAGRPEALSVTFAAPRAVPVDPHADADDLAAVLLIDGDQEALIVDSTAWAATRLRDLGAPADWRDATHTPTPDTATASRTAVEEWIAKGGEGTVVVLEGSGHSPHLEKPAEFRRALLTRIGYIGLAADPAPPTETIILSSSD